MNKILITLLVILGGVFCAEPPIYNFSYFISFDDAFIVNGTRNQVTGQMYYDPLNNRQRVDRDNGRYDAFCGSVLPNLTTACSHYTLKSQRWIVFPQKLQCCFCCDSDHGCGILKPDWLKDATYLGEQTIGEAKYDQWSQDGMFGYNYQWVSKQADKIPRRLDQGGRHITDFSTASFKKQVFADSIFTLPQYCNTQSPLLCPAQSTCGKHRSVNLKIE